MLDKITEPFHFLTFLVGGGWPWKVRIMLSQPSLAGVGAGAELGKSCELFMK